MSALSHFGSHLDATGLPLPIFAELGPLPIWVAWRIGKPKDDGGFGKPPVPCRQDGEENYTIDGRNWQDTANHVDLDTALDYARRYNLPGVGIVVRPEHGLAVGDLDHVISGKAIQPWAREIVASNGEVNVYVETSPSGTGLRFICRGRGSVPEQRNGVELFDGTAVKFVTVTAKPRGKTPLDLRHGQAVVDRALARAGSVSTKAVQGGTVVQHAAVTPLSALNTIAMAHLDAWVPKRFPGAHRSDAGVWRVSPDELCRVTQEDLSIAPAGITDFGLHDSPDETRAGKRSPVDLYLSPYCDETAVMRAAAALATDLGLPETLRPVLRDASTGFGSAEPANVFLDKGQRVAVSWPSDALPTGLDAYACAVARAKGLSSDAGRFVALVVVANVITSGVRLRPYTDDTWTTHPALYGCVVAPPSGHKTGLLREFVRPLYAIEADWQRSHDRANKDVREGLRPPVRRRLVDDVTPEALVRLLSEQGDGLFAVPAELRPFLSRFGRYTNGGAGAVVDQGLFIAAFDGEAIRVDRRDQGKSLSVNVSHLGIVTTTQPDALAPLLPGMLLDGFGQRWFFFETGSRGLPDRSVDLTGPTRDYQEVVKLLLNVRHAFGGQIVIEADAEASALGKEIERWTIAESARTDHSDAFRQFLGKTTGAVSRIALAIHCAEWAYEAGDDLLGWDVETGIDLPRVMTCATLDRAWRLYREAIVPSATNVYAHHGVTSLLIEDVRTIATWLLKQERREGHTLGPRDLYGPLNKFRGEVGGRRLKAAMADLEQAAWVKLDPLARFDAPRWIVNDAIHDMTFAAAP